MIFLGDMFKGTVVRTLIPKLAEGIFDVIATFNKTNEYVLYYHSGRKTIRLVGASPELRILADRGKMGVFEAINLHC